jgi:hypothetical protein
VVSVWRLFQSAFYASSWQRIQMLASAAKVFALA